MGAGTGSNAEYFGEDLKRIGLLELVDCCEPLLAQARRRIGEAGWRNVVCREGDACTWHSDSGPCDAVYFSYALSMIPDWTAAIEHALGTLVPGGVIGVVDFYVSPCHPPHGMRRHSAFQRLFWPRWFAHDGVHLREELLPHLLRRCEALYVREGSGPVPFIPGLRVPYVVFVGRPRS